MATAVVRDKIIHHSVILEFGLPSYRTYAGQNRQTDRESDRPEWLMWVTRCFLWKRLHSELSKAVLTSSLFCYLWGMTSWRSDSQVGLSVGNSTQKKKPPTHSLSDRDSRGLISRFCTSENA